MRYMVFACAVSALAACGQSTAPPDLPPPTVSVRPTPWLICDGIDAPVLLLFADSPDDGRVRVERYDKTTGAIVSHEEINTSPGDAAAGSVYTQLMRDGANIGAVRQINPGMMETPGAAYTTPFTSVALDDLQLSCRWLPRTRLFGFTGRRSFVVHEDADGDLIYTTFDFGPGADTRPIDLSENGRSTTFSVEVRGGEERRPLPGSVEFRFTGADNYSYVISASGDGTGALDVERAGQAVQSEPLIAYQLGQAEQE